MACVLTTGFSDECDDSAGGVKKDSVLIAQLDDIDAFTVTAGEITVLDQVAATNFYRYAVRKEIANAVSTGTKDPIQGTTVIETVFTTTLHKLSAAKNEEIKLLTGKPCVIIYQDQNDVYHCTGITNGAELLAPVSQTGVSMNDMNGYTLAFTAREKNFPYTVDPTVVAGLTIA